MVVLHTLNRLEDEMSCDDLSMGVKGIVNAHSGLLKAFLPGKGKANNVPP